MTGPIAGGAHAEQIPGYPRVERPGHLRVERIADGPHVEQTHSGAHAEHGR